MDFAVPADRRVKIKESEKRDKCLDLARELKKTMEPEGYNDTRCGWCTWNNHQSIGKGTGRLEIKRTNSGHPDYSIIKIEQNTENSSGDL